MANTKIETKKTTKPALNAAALLRKGTRAYIGLYGAAFQRIQMRLEQGKGATDGLFAELVSRGTEIEKRAANIAVVAQTKTMERLSIVTDKAANFIPVAANNRVAELELEVAQLNAQIEDLAKRAKKSKAKVKMTTEKTSKAA